MSQHFPRPARSGLRPLGAALAVVALGLVPGCSPAVGEVRGKVYFKGKEVTSGFVTLVGKDGIPRTSEIAEDGSYRITDVPVGEAKVVVNSPPLDPTRARRKPPKRPGVESPDVPGRALTENQKKTWRELPARYADVSASDLRYTVAPGPNAYDIKLD